MQSTNEQWRPVLGYEGLYEVSDHGRVKSLGRYVGGAYGARYWAERIMKGSPAVAGGYPIVRLRRDGKGRTHHVHRLVLDAFVGPHPGRGHHVRHWDGDPANNHVSNLRYGTVAENSDDARRHGTRIRGERVGGAKLTSDQVLTIRERLRKGETQRSVSEGYDVTLGAIEAIAQGRNWAWLD